jgi:hypothetical protein
MASAENSPPTIENLLVLALGLGSSPSVCQDPAKPYRIFSVSG